MLKLFYKCTCLPAEREVEVRFRKEGEDVVAWMQKVVTPGVGSDHTKRSPGCRKEKLEWVKIPVPENADGIGEKPRLDS